MSETAKTNVTEPLSLTKPPEGVEVVRKFEPGEALFEVKVIRADKEIKFACWGKHLPDMMSLVDKVFPITILSSRELKASLPAKPAKSATARYKRITMDDLTDEKVEEWWAKNGKYHSGDGVVLSPRDRLEVCEAHYGFVPFPTHLGNSVNRCKFCKCE